MCVLWAFVRESDRRRVVLLLRLRRHQDPLPLADPPTPPPVSRRRLAGRGRPSTWSGAARRASALSYGLSCLSPPLSSSYPNIGFFLSKHLAGRQVAAGRAADAASSGIPTAELARARALALPIERPRQLFGKDLRPPTTSEEHKISVCRRLSTVQDASFTRSVS